MTDRNSFGSKPLGFMLTLAGGILWAIGGTCGQRIFQLFSVSSDWLVPIRLLISGSILLIAALCLQGKTAVFQVFRHKRDCRDLIFFSIFGAGASQYTYYTCIQYSNAAFATVISYMFPALILLYFLLKTKRPPKAYEWISVLLVSFGAFVCTTHLELGSLSVSPPALIFGLICAVASAYNTVKPQRLLRIYPLIAIMAWSMLIGGLVLCVLCRPWRFPVTHTPMLWLLMGVVIIGGTIFAFCFFQAGVRIVGSLAGSILASVEPIGAVVLAVVFLNISFTKEDFLGFVCILATIPLIAIGQSREERLAKALSEELLEPESAETDQTTAPLP